MLESNGVADVVSYVSNELGIFLCSVPRSSIPSKKQKNIILYVNNLHPMAFVPEGGKCVQVNTYYGL